MRFRDLVLDESQLARLGGDEFVFHLSGTKEVAESLARRIIEVASAPFDVDADEDCFLGASVGIASYPDGGRVAEDLLRNADTAMYEAKSEGRGVYRSFDPPMARKKINELQIRRDLRHATFRDELRLFYQPAFSLKSGLLSGAEALVRWQHPTRGLLGAASFVGLAEESQLMAMIGRWAVDEVCRQIGQWLTEGLEPPRISINLDARYFSDPSLPRLVGELLARYGVAPHHLGLEITEGMLIPDPAGAAQVLKVLHSMGIRISLDDFGTGYSNLGYLQRFPIDTLKIDQSFVKNLCSNDENSSARLTRSILAMGAALGVRTLAEGVETPEQLEFLNRSGCDCAQGFLFSPAVPAGTFAHEFLKSPMPPNDPA
jgi:EAL domain-containing protein (putative c-di-GMP-specific phosphodiesterase class I)